MLARRDFLSSALAASAAAACASAPPILPVTHPDPRVYDACRGRTPSTFSILTWNVFLMPGWTYESPRNEPRAAAIGATLLDHPFDVVCLQKVFDESARAVLNGVLAERYPYRYGPANPSKLKLSSGVWLLSRHPLDDYQEIQFGECSSVECFSRKGALLVSGTCGSTPFRLITTHLQGEEGPRFTEKNQRIRAAQMLEIRDRLITPHLEPNVPFVICGDFGTPRLDDTQCRETDAYRGMLSSFEAENGAALRVTLDDDVRNNQLARDNTGRKNELDYVLLRKNGYPVAIERTRHVFRRGGWDDSRSERTDLSYRYAVSAKLTFPG